MDDRLNQQPFMNKPRVPFMNSSLWRSTTDVGNSPSISGSRCNHRQHVSKRSKCCCSVSWADFWWQWKDIPSIFTSNILKNIQRFTSLGFVGGFTAHRASEILHEYLLDAVVAQTCVRILLNHSFQPKNGRVLGHFQDLPIQWLANIWRTVHSRCTLWHPEVQCQNIARKSSQGVIRICSMLPPLFDLQ